MAECKEKLFTEFPPVSTSEWMEKVTTDLKGADFAKRLVWKTKEGFNVQPMYRAEDIENLKTTDALPGEYPYIRGTKKCNSWKVRQDIDTSSLEEANKKALDILNKGVDSLGFKLKADHLNVESLAILLKDICVECIEINFSTCGKKAPQLVEALTAYYAAANVDATKAKGSINFDPMSRMLKRGRDAADFAELGAALIKATESLPKYKVITINGSLLSNAGGYISQELGYTLAWGNEWMAKLTEVGVTPDVAAKSIKFNFGISSNYFMEMAKFRAARMLWAQIVATYKPESSCAAKMQIHAQTSEFNMTIFDAHVNLLRSQTEAMSAALAGVDSLTVTPFDKCYQTPDDFSERIARNQQLLLKEESHFDKIVDPAAGSYYVETLTVSIAEQAWKLFLTVEEKGGFYAALKEGYIQSEIQASSTARHEAMARRSEILLGTNQYPNFNEMAKGKIAEKPTKGHCCGGHAHTCEKQIETLSFERAASDFEALRLATEAATKRPKVFMLTIGNLAMRLARSQFSSNFFACAGYEVIDNLGFDTAEAGVEAAVAAKADIVVICSSDDEYAQYAPEALQALAGRAELVVAGAPACMAELQSKGIEQFIHVRTNVLDTLRAFNAKLAI